MRDEETTVVGHMRAGKGKGWSYELRLGDNFICVPQGEVRGRMVKEKVTEYLRGLKPAPSSRQEAEEDGTHMRYTGANAIKVKVPGLQVELETVNPDMDEPLGHRVGCHKEYVVKWGEEGVLVY
jgi:hypothetical protein